MTFAYCLADFYNLGITPSGRSPNAADIRDGIHELATAVNAAAAVSNKIISDLTLRLYGGWHEAGVGPTAHRHLIEGALRSFPRRLGGRLRIQLAESTIALPHLHFTDTVRPTQPLRNLRANSVARRCPRRDKCRVPDFLKWLEGTCPEAGCGTSTETLLLDRQQKTVDTLLTADAVHLAHTGNTDLILLASDDDDFLPALLAASSTGVEVVSMLRRDPAKVRYAPLLESAGVRLFYW